MPFVEGFTNTVLSDNSDEKKKEMLNLLLIVLAVKFVLIYVVAVYLWPKVMPSIFPGVKANPGFLEVLGLWFISNIIFH
jgi:hypothetical protein|tara:strand:- start:1834 stop:2070 length:237 start_codon:yes stop_codon:yes gene_type:complete